MNRTRRLLSLSWILLPLLPSACGGAREPGSRAPDYPRQTLNVMAPAAPGGGWDQTARAMQAALAASTGQQAQVYNVAGAGGAVGLAHFIGDHAGDPHQLLVGGLVMVGATAANQSPVQWLSTSLAHLTDQLWNSSPIYNIANETMRYALVSWF
jgi:putative tricarboxylic transport membrane protein